MTDEIKPHAICAAQRTLLKPRQTSLCDQDNSGNQAALSTDAAKTVAQSFFDKGAATVACLGSQELLLSEPQPRGTPR